MGYNTVVVVPPAKPPDRKDDKRVRERMRCDSDLFEGNESVYDNIGVIALLYESISIKLRAAVPPCRITFGVLPS